MNRSILKLKQNFSKPYLAMHRGDSLYTNKPFYIIGGISSICGNPQKTLRYYGEIGLLSPERRNERAHYRYYSKSQVITLFTIKALKK